MESNIKDLEEKRILNRLLKEARSTYVFIHYEELFTLSLSVESAENTQLITYKKAA